MENINENDFNGKIMIQGTSSGSGKSTITAGLCRALSNRGISVCPYKSQNMSLNSYITLDGKEMGRAQVMQAECARIEPEAYMNPILLKPQGDRTSQVIFKGEVFGTMSAMEYEKVKASFKKELKKEFIEIEKKYSAVVIEGAGSPAEINLRTNDIVNMGLAELVDSPVILVGDIDKGGVFAALYGTVMLLGEEERKRIKGFIINKFRGDIKILEPGIKMMEDMLKIPCLGVVPHFNLELEDEDGAVHLNTEIKDKIDVAVVFLPHISNFTDVLPLEMEEDVSVRYIKKESDFGKPDLLIIPGTKNTIGDLSYLKENKIYDRIIKYSENGGRVVGICGGYQMLLEWVKDPHKIEGSKEEIKGLGLLLGSTEIAKTKVMKRSKGEIGYKGKNYPVTGYEIHMGETVSREEVLIEGDNLMDGAIKERVMGTYFHGVFDEVPFREALVNELRKEKGIDEKASPNFKKRKDAAMEELSKIMEDNLKMEEILKIMRR